MTFLATTIVAAFTLVAAIVPPIHLSQSAEEPFYPAAPGYLLPWPGGQIHGVTQGEETTFTHNGLSAYAFDFDLDYDTVVASRSGKIAMVDDGSNTGGCSSEYATASNYVVVDHGDGTSSLYLHLAYDSVKVAVGDIVERGQPLAISGETGVTCSDDGTTSAPHLHFQVQRMEEGRYFTQSLPIAFDDLRANGGVLEEGALYVSANYARGKLQMLTITPHRVERVFNPVAVPLEPGFIEVDDTLPLTETQSPESLAETETPVATDTPEETATPEDTETPWPTETPSFTPTPPASQTPTPSILPIDTVTVPPPTETPTPESPQTMTSSPTPDTTQTPTPVPP